MASKITPGILYVTMQPKDSLPPSQFHDWYNNEHGPGRLRLSFCRNGFRYCAIDLDSQPGTQDKPEWMAIYDIEDMDYLTKDVYTRLRAAPVQSQRERDTMKQIHVDRRFYDFIKEWKGQAFGELEKVENEGKKNVMIAVSFTLKEGKGNEEELRKWYDEEHVPLLQKVPGWRRTRRFVTSYLDLNERKKKEFLALHEYAPENGLGGKEFTQATSTTWCDKIYKEIVQGRKRRVYNLYYTFGPAERDLQSLASQETFQTQSTNELTNTYPAPCTPEKRPAIESFINTPDAVRIAYRLEGSPDPNAPLLVLVNSILVEFGIWDDFVSHFLRLTNNGYRILRFNTRGRTKLPQGSDRKITVDTLVNDIVTMLDALRIKSASIVGVSLGGCTALKAALSFPQRIKAFVSCDTNSVAPPSNPKAWAERIEIAEKEGKQAVSGENIVGEELAELTVRRWFVKESYDDAELSKKIERVKEMVKTNSLSGFKDGVKALYEYDFRPLMASYQGKGAFLVGAGDGVLPKTMKEMADSLGSGVELKVIDKAGHLPMVERPEEVAEFLAKFLEG